ncbi:hypothetical protein FD754_010353 [Muntiacus muntjak]|uniref:Ubiquitin-like-conjugating enzyme ATG10 n=1 Tax=Muntiacus muntjak TaxID=9888 RepID=A0A5N3WZA1_MUNMU|nr:hypothetical protein FD754_010353 [Muntiacus muntjak]
MEMFKKTQNYGHIMQYKRSSFEIYLTNSTSCKITFLFKMELGIVQHTMNHLLASTIESLGTFHSLSLNYPPLDDFEVTETTAAAEVIKYEYHVLYSCSYQVPVLYFRASFLDGRPLALKDIWEGVHECYKTRLLQGPWDTITQQSFTHRCICKKKKKNYI